VFPTDAEPYSTFAQRPMAAAAYSPTGRTVVDSTAATFHPRTPWISVGLSKCNHDTIVPILGSATSRQNVFIAQPGVPLRRCRIFVPPENDVRISGRLLIGSRVSEIAS